MALRNVLRALVPPLLWRGLQVIKASMFSHPESLAFAPDAWNTPLPRDHSAHDSGGEYLRYELRSLEALKQRLMQNAPLLLQPSVHGAVDDRPASRADDIGNRYLAYATFAHVLAMATRNRDALSILDFGSGLGDYYWVARSVLPDVAFDYHCVDLPRLVAAGRDATPRVTWHTGEECLDSTYDLVIFSASLQYLPNWKSVIERAALASRRYLFLSQVSTVLDGPGYVAVQRVRGMTMLHQQIARPELLAAVESTGMRVLREFMMAQHPPVIGAPSQPVYRGWLCERY